MTGHITSDWNPLPGTSGPNHVFAIGDVHGRDDLLRDALAVIESIEKAGETKRAVFIGDLIDRGPGGLVALSAARNAWDYGKVEDRVLLFGNHEIMLWEALNENQPNQKGRKAPTAAEGFETKFSLWKQSGGDAVIAEIEALGFPASTGEDLTTSLRKLCGGDPLRGFKSHHREGDLFFVHAGVDPYADRDNFLKAPRYHYAWTRLPFLTEYGSEGQQDREVVVHGHTPWAFDPLSSACEDEMILFEFPDELRPESTVGAFKLTAGDMVNRARRINLDAGCGFDDNPLVFAEFTGDHYRMHAVGHIA